MVRYAHMTRQLCYHRYQLIVPLIILTKAHLCISIHFNSLEFPLQYTSNDVIQAIRAVHAMNPLEVSVVSVNHQLLCPEIVPIPIIAFIINLVLKAEKEYCVASAVRDSCSH